METWDGTPIDLPALSGRGYLDPVDRHGVLMPRLEAYLNAALAEAGNRIAAAALSLGGRSTSSVTIGAGSKTWTMDSNRALAAGMIVSVSADTGNYMIGEITSYDSASGTLIIDALDVVGAGTFTSWVVSLSARRGSTGATGDAGVAGAAGSGSTVAAALNGSIVTVAPRAVANFQRSITVADNSGAGRFDVQLVNDTLAPGNSYYYGTDGAGVKGYNSLSAVVVSLIPFASNADATAATSTAKALVPANIPSIISGNITKFTRITSGGTFSRDARTVGIEFTAIGGGQAGDGGAIGGGIGGAGGYGGEIVTRSFAAADVPSSVTVIIGAGGTGGSGAGPAGGATTIGTLITARGGSAAAAYRAGRGGAGGSGTGTSGAAGYYIGDSTSGIAGADGTPGAGISGNSAGTLTGSAATSPTARGAGGAGGGGAQNLNAGAVGGHGASAASAGGGGGGGGAAVSFNDVATNGNGGSGAGGEVWVVETFGA